MVLYSSLLHLPLLRFHCVGGCWFFEPRTAATLALLQSDALTTRQCSHQHLSEHLLSFGVWLLAGQQEMQDLAARGAEHSPSQIPANCFFYSPHSTHCSSLYPTTLQKYIRRGPNYSLLSSRWVHPNQKPFTEDPASEGSNILVWFGSLCVLPSP